jgi:hypothetical protein
MCPQNHGTYEVIPSVDLRPLPHRLVAKSQSQEFKLFLSPFILNQLRPKCDSWTPGFSESSSYRVVVKRF